MSLGHAIVLVKVQTVLAVRSSYCPQKQAHRYSAQVSAHNIAVEQEVAVTSATTPDLGSLVLAYVRSATDDCHQLCESSSHSQLITPGNPRTVCQQCPTKPKVSAVTGCLQFMSHPSGVLAGAGQHTR